MCAPDLSRCVCLFVCVLRWAVLLVTCMNRPSGEQLCLAFRPVVCPSRREGGVLGEPRVYAADFSRRDWWRSREELVGEEHESQRGKFFAQKKFRG